MTEQQTFLKSIIEEWKLKELQFSRKKYSGNTAIKSNFYRSFYIYLKFLHEFICVFMYQK